MESGGDGKVIPEKTEEQFAQERFERYQKDPNSFVEILELVLAVKRTPDGLAYLIGNTTVNELKIVKYDLDMQIDSTIGCMIAEKRSKIIPAKGSMFSFARRRK